VIELNGKFNMAKVFTDNIEASAVGQITNMLNLEFVSDSKIRIMPDVHMGAGCTIGTTMTITDKIVPNWVGVDIGCGMETVRLKESHIELTQLDKVIKLQVPAGFEVRKKAHHYADQLDLNKLVCAKHMKIDRALLSIGTLGGGNHFIELCKDENDSYWLTVHSGSRNLGKQIAEHYQNKAAKEMKTRKTGIARELAYVDGELFENYLFDAKLAQEYATLNRKAMIKVIQKALGVTIEDSFSTIHNYIDMSDEKNRILRKGAISAKDGERVLIPLNMRDGSLLCVGKGNPDWNFSAPHGAGRLMSRSEAKSKITLPQFEETMKGIYSTTINRNTIDEAPFAYKPTEEITNYISDTVDIISTLRPVYNFKAAE